MALSSSELSELIRIIESDDLTVTSEFLNNIKYTGFDALAFRKETLSYANIKDIYKLCVFITIRGTNGAKAVDKMSKEGKEEIMRLVKAMKITMSSSRRRGSPMTAKMRTLGRLSAAFPDLIAKAMVMHPPRLQFEVPDQFSFICSPSAASIIPKDRTDNAEIHWKWTLAFDSTVNGAGTEQGALRNYWAAAHNSSLIRNSLSSEESSV